MIEIVISVVMSIVLMYIIYSVALEPPTTTSDTVPVDIPVGTIVPYAGGTLPPGWLLCDNASYPPTKYPALYAAIGYTYGMDGTNYRVPDTRGVFMRGTDPTGRRDTPRPAGAVQLGMTTLPAAPVGTQNSYLRGDGSWQPGTFSGQITWSATATPPPGWLVCDGASYFVTAYPALFAAISTMYGVGADKTGGTTFSVPDLRGQFIRGFDSTGNVDRDRGGKGFGTYQGDMFGRHNHGPDMGRRGDASERLLRWGDNDQRVSFGRSEDTGGTETRPKNVALLPCIKI